MKIYTLSFTSFDSQHIIYIKEYKYKLELESVLKMCLNDLFKSDIRFAFIKMNSEFDNNDNYLIFVDKDDVPDNQQWMSNKYRFVITIKNKNEI